MIADIIVALITCYIIYELIINYKTTIGSFLERIFEALKKTTASMWTGFTVAVSVVIGWLAQLADFLNAPNVASALTTYGSPKVVAALMIAAAVILEYARRKKSTIAEKMLAPPKDTGL